MSYVNYVSYVSYVSYVTLCYVMLRYVTLCELCAPLLIFFQLSFTYKADIINVNYISKYTCVHKQQEL